MDFRRNHRSAGLAFPVFMNGSHAHPNIPLIFVAAALFAYGGWYHFFNTRKVCEMIATKGWPRFLAKVYSGRFAYAGYKVMGILCFLSSLFLFGLGVFSLVNRWTSN